MPEDKKQLAGCVIEDEEGRILLLHRNTAERKQWEIPGGKIEPNENPRDTARREIFEELGVKIEILNEIGKQDFIEENNQMGYLWYKAEIISGTPTPLEKGHDKVNYFSWDELIKMNDLSPNAKNFVVFHTQNKYTLGNPNE